MTTHALHLDTEARDTWTAVLNALVDDIAAWCRDAQWLVSRRDMALHEEKIGEYLAPALTVHTPQGPLIVEPVARDVAGADGRVDITSFPSYQRMLLVRIGDEWKLKTDSGVPWPRAWGRETFLDLASVLVAAG